MTTPKRRILSFVFAVLFLICVTSYRYVPGSVFSFVQTVIFTFQVNPGEEEKEAQEALGALKEEKVK